MSVTGQTLKEIHRLRRYAKELTTKIEQAPRQLKAQENNLARLEEGFKQAQEVIKHLKVQIHDKEVSIKSIQGVIKKHTKQFDEAANKKEYDALKVEIENEKKSIIKLEDEILEHMTEVEDKSARLPELEKSLQKARADFAQFQTDQKERVARFTEEKQKTLAALGAVEKDLPDDILVTYMRQINSRGEDALAAVEGRTCVACYTEITAQMLNELGRGMFVPCRSCGRILYLPE